MTRGTREAGTAKAVTRRPESVEGVDVYLWYTREQAEHDLGISPRELHYLDEKGLPSVGTGRDRRYPVPHLFVWYAQYKVHLALGEVVTRLPFRVALAEHELGKARFDAEHELKVRPRRK